MKLDEHSYQAEARKWAEIAFGPEIAADKVIRNFRFLEEALELVQAGGCTKEDALKLVDYVYGRPVGEVFQEAGGVMTTFACLCTAQGVDMEHAGDTELQRCWANIDKIRAKQAAKLTMMGDPTPAQLGEINAG